MKELESDVVIISAGTAGLPAAVAATEGGARVITFEKASTTGGTGNMAMGPFAVESNMQRLRQIALTKEEAFKIYMEYTHWRVDARLISAFINKSGDTIGWLERLGVEFADIQAHNLGYNYTWHIVKSTDGGVAPGSGANMLRILTEKAREKGVKIHLQTPVRRILKEGNRITGVLADDRNGNEIRAKARAVIIATGGFGDDPKLIKKYTGYEWGKDLFSTRIPGLVGDGIRMAREIGAMESEMIMHLSYGSPWSSSAGDETQPFLPGLNLWRQPNLIVNLGGERFVNEGIIETTPFAVNAINMQKNRCAVSIFDDAIIKEYEENGLDTLGPAPQTIEINNIRADIEKALELGHENIFMADTIEELAGKAGIKADALLRTVAEYNMACETGRDNILHKDPRYLRPIKQPTYYACKLFPFAMGSLGGIRINHRTEVIGKDHEVIPGLYAAGADANSTYSDTYLFYMPGSTFGFAVNSGRMAGENAAEYIKSVDK